MSDSDAAKLVASIETEMFDIFRNTDSKYMNKYRTIMFNLKDPRNKVCSKLLSAISIDRCCMYSNTVSFFGPGLVVSGCTGRHQSFQTGQDEPEGYAGYQGARQQCQEHITGKSHVCCQRKRRRAS